MPATERSFTADFPPRHLYLDTDILLNVLSPNQPFHEQCLAFMERLAQHGLTTIHLSTVSWMEVAHRATRPQFRRELPSGVQSYFQLDRWDDRTVRHTYLQEVLRLIQDILAPFEWDEIAVTPDAFGVAAHLMAEYNLEGQGAMHLACMSRIGVRDLASFDRGFRRVDWLYLWNDLIHQ